MLMQTIDSALVLFPAMPTDTDDVSFTTLRATGAFLISARWQHAHVSSPVRVVSMAGAPLVLAKPWPKVCVHKRGAGAGSGEWAAVATVDEAGRGLPDVDPLGRVKIPTTAGVTYELSKC